MRPLLFLHENVGSGVCTACQGIMGQLTVSLCYYLRGSSRGEVYGIALA